MRKAIALFLGISTLIFLGIASIANASTLQGFQGGTGIPTSSIANDNNCLKQVSSTPFLLYAFGSCGTGGGGSTTTINQLSNGSNTFYFVGSNGLTISTSSTSTITFTQGNPSTTIPVAYVASLNGSDGVYNLYVASPFLSIATGTGSSTITFSSSSLNLLSAAYRAATDFLASSTNLAPSTTIPTVYVATNTGNWAGTWGGFLTTNFLNSSTVVNTPSTTIPTVFVSSILTATGTVTLATSGPLWGNITQSAHQLTFSSISTSTLAGSGFLNLSQYLTTAVTSFNGSTGAVTGLSSVASSTGAGGISASAPTGSAISFLVISPLNLNIINASTSQIASLSDASGNKYSTSTSGGGVGTSSLGVYTPGNLSFFINSSTISASSAIQFTSSTGFLALLNDLSIGTTTNPANSYLYIASTTGIFFVGPTSTAILSNNLVDASGNKYSTSTAVGGGSLTFTSSSLPYVKILDSTNTAVTISNSAATGSLYSYSVPANTLSVNGAAIRVTMTGKYMGNATGTANLPQFSLVYGNSVVASGTATAVPSSSVSGAFSLVFTLANASGSASNQYGSFDGSINTNRNTAVFLGGNGTSSIDSTQAQNLVIWGKNNLVSSTIGFITGQVVTELVGATTTVVTNITSTGLPTMATTTKTIYDVAPTSTDYPSFIMNSPGAFTIREVDCYNDNAAGNTFLFNVVVSSTVTTAASYASSSLLFAGNQTCTATSSVSALTSFANASVAAGQSVWLWFPSLASSTGAHVQIDY